MQISKCNVISGYGKFWMLDEMFQWKKNKYHILPPLDGSQGLTGAWHHIQLSSLILAMKHTTNE